MKKQLHISDSDSNLNHSFKGQLILIDLFFSHDKASLRQSQPIPHPQSSTTEIVLTPRSLAVPEVRTNSIEEIEIKIEKKSKTTVDNSNDEDSTKVSRAIEPLQTNTSTAITNNNHNNNMTNDHLKNAALQYLLEKSASRIKANELNKQHKSMESVAYNLERSFPIHFKTTPAQHVADLPLNKPPVLAAKDGKSLFIQDLISPSSIDYLP